MSVATLLYSYVVKDQITYMKIMFSILLATWGVWLWSRRKFYLLSMKLPGPRSWPIIGNALDIGVFGQGHEIIQNVKKMGDSFPSPFCVWLGTDFCVIITEPEDLEVVLLNKASSQKDKRYDLFFPCIGKGLLSASGELWKRHRHLLNPSFRASSVRRYQNIHNKHARHLIETLIPVCNKGIVDVVVYCKRCVADVVAEALFELNMEYYKGEKDFALDITTQATELIHDRMTKFWQEFDILYMLSNESKLLKNVMINYRKFFHTLIKKKIDIRLDMQTNKIDNSDTAYEYDENSNKSGSPFAALMKGMIDGKLDEKEVMDEFHNIYNPGMDTTYSQVSSFMMILGMHRDKQDKLWREVKDYYKDDLDAEVLSDDLNKLPYLEMCIKELFRLFPTGPIFMRVATEDLELKKKNIIIPKGTYITISLFILHRNPKYWHNPDAFVPERFSPECSKKRPHFAYLPFSAGQRNCIAQHFAMDMLKTIAIHLIRNYEFHSDLKMEDVTIKADISARSAIGYNVSIFKRNRDN